MTTYNITWAWGTNQSFLFDPQFDVINFGWFAANQFTVSSTEDSVVISIPSNQQTYTFTGVTLGQMTMGNILANDTSTLNKWQDLLNDAPAPGPTPPKPDPDPAPGPAPDPAPGPTPTGGKLFSPYIDMGLTVSQHFPGMCQVAGVKSISLGFLVGAGNNLVWGGSYAHMEALIPTVADARAKGIEVIPSLGGQVGPDPATTFSDGAALGQALIQMAKAYQIKRLDFDVEGDLVGNAAVRDIRNKALQVLQAAMPDLIISFTLAVLPTGLPEADLALLTTAKAAGVRVDVMNIMAMDYGSSFDMGGQMGLCAISAAKATYAQCKAIMPDIKIGVTPMIGLNDTIPECFNFDDARSLVAFAQATDWVESLGMWSLGRDNGSTVGSVSYAGSGLVQDDYAFAAIFNTL